LALREQCIHRAIFSTTLFSIPKLFENSKKSPRGIDKIKIRFIIECGELWGKRVKKEHTMRESVESEILSGVSRSHGHSLNILRVLLFCMKYPKLKFTAECVAVNQGVDRAALEKEIQDLISHGILGKKNDAGITYYCLNGTRQELTELTEEFLRDWHLHEIGVTAEGA
jgi:hypothetical protein